MTLQLERFTKVPYWTLSHNLYDLKGTAIVVASRYDLLFLVQIDSDESGPYASTKRNTYASTKRITP
jgi:hypothetical protein